MEGRRSEYDVSNRVNVTNPDAVHEEICDLFQQAYPDSSIDTLKRSFQIVTDLFSGQYAGFLPCDTPYHDIQHTLDVTLALTRLIVGQQRSEMSKLTIDQELAETGIIVALFHDAGYIRRSADRSQNNGAAYTSRHVSRSARFLASVLPGLGLGHRVPLARKLVHFTGYEKNLQTVRFDRPECRLMGSLLGTSDLLAQMSDRCYLEKCRDYLYPEFVLAGYAGPMHADSAYQSAEELISKTPGFFAHVRERMDGVMDGVHRYAGTFFMPERNFYFEALEKNRVYLDHVVERGDLTLLRRNPPWTLTLPPESIAFLT